MEKIKKILAPTDLSELSQAGVRYALELAGAVGSEVTIYNVVNAEDLIHYGEGMKTKIVTDPVSSPVDSLLEKYRSALSQFVRAHFADLIAKVTVREKVEIGAPAANIVEQAEKKGIDLIVISTHGRSGLAHMLLGSVTENVVRRAPCPVLSIRPRLEQKRSEKAA